MAKIRFLLGAALMLSVAALAVSGARQPPKPPTRCRVEAKWAPIIGMDNIGHLDVFLRPGCPPDGVANIRLGNYGNFGSQMNGPQETLTPLRPALAWNAQPYWRTVLWQAQSGKLYRVPIQRE